MMKLPLTSASLLALGAVRDGVMEVSRLQTHRDDMTATTGCTVVQNSPSSFPMLASPSSTMVRHTLGVLFATFIVPS